MKARCIVVPPAEQWIDSYDRKSPTAWHAKQNDHNMAMMITQFNDSVCYRNFCAVIQSLPSQPHPCRPPLLRP
eukprot:6526131-Pyramimonas_sp.AAC.1